MKAKTNKKKTEKVVNEIKFTKEQIVNSKKFAKNVDLLRATLKENEKYTLKEVYKIIENFMKGKVS